MAQMMQQMGGSPEMMQQMMMFQQFAGVVMSTNPAMQWKQKLHEACQRNAITEKPEYSATADPSGGGFLGTVTLQGISYTSEETAANKKAAEQGAAKAAMQALFEEEFEMLSSQDTSVWSGAMPAITMGTQEGGASRQKRKADSLEDATSRSKLQRGVTLWLVKNSARNIVAGDITYDLQEFEGGGYQSTVNIKEVEGGSVYAGEVKASKTEAHEAAATTAYETLKDIFAPLEEEHTIKIKKQKHESKKGGRNFNDSVSPEVMKLARQVKEGQKASEEFKEAWGKYCQDTFNDVRNPMKHSVESIETFLATAPAVEIPELDPIKEECIIKIKGGQKSSTAYKNSWHEHCKKNHGPEAKFDPAKYDAAFLNEFLLEHPPP